MVWDDALEELGHAVIASPYMDNPFYSVVVERSEINWKQPCRLEDNAVIVLESNIEEHGKGPFALERIFLMRNGDVIFEFLKYKG